MIIVCWWLLTNHAAYWDVSKGETILCDTVDLSIAVATEKVLFETSLGVSQKLSSQASHHILFQFSGLDDSNCKKCWSEVHIINILGGATLDNFFSQLSFHSVDQLMLCFHWFHWTQIFPVFNFCSSQRLKNLLRRHGLGSSSQMSSKAALSGA